tara:strand:+ start:813 stop:2507 length:1695 start_codon:yes stop_codon:yes gene_type:complete
MNSISVTGKNWILKESDQNKILYLKDNFFLDEIIAKLLVLRNINTEDINSFLNPSIKNFLPNPENLQDMKKTSIRMIEAIEKNEKVGVFGDYDVDGASSTALLGKYFDELNLKYNFYIPDRKTEGYGPSIKGFKELIDKNVKIIFTVDCGTLSYEAIDYAKNQKIDVIVLDHHQSEIKLPNAFSVVNPNRLDDTSNLKYLCAAGVTFMFLVSINKHLRSIDWFNKNCIKEPNLINYLDLVSLGTVCDVVPLIGLNRAIVKQGLKILKFKKNLGIKTLLDICKIETNPSIYHLGYILGPRINAGGRVGKCSHGANLLLNSNPKEVFKLASELDLYNKERQMIEKDLIEKILKNVANKVNDPILILKGENWHEGVIGIVAARLTDKFNKPAIVISFKDKIGKASARSVFGFDIGSAIISASQKKILIKGGGHKMAGGFTIDISNLEKFKEFMFNKFSKINDIMPKEKKLYLDCKIAPSAINLEFYEKVNSLSPFGSGNPEPKFIMENLRLLNSKIVGEKHIKSVLIGPEGTSIKTIAFNATDNELGVYLSKKKTKHFQYSRKIVFK